MARYTSKNTLKTSYVQRGDSSVKSGMKSKALDVSVSIIGATVDLDSAKKHNLFYL